MEYRFRDIMQPHLCIFITGPCVAGRQPVRYSFADAQGNPVERDGQVDWNAPGGPVIRSVFGAATITLRLSEMLSVEECAALRQKGVYRADESPVGVSH